MDASSTLALGLIAFGLLLILADLVFTTGVLAVAGLIVIAAGVALPFYYGNTSMGVALLIGVVIGVPATVAGAWHYWRRTAAGRRMVLTAPSEDSTVAALPEIAELDRLQGRLGQAVSPLRPAGIVDFDGRRVDCLAEGALVEAGTWVRCLSAKAGKVIVRPVAEPKLSDLENADFS